MKKLGFLLSIMIFFSGFAMAQTERDYKSRNHKFHKNNASKQEIVKPIANKEVTTEAHVYDYRKRNHKFHSHAHDNVLLIKKEKIEYDYRALNHKFKKGQKNKFINQISKDDMLSEN